jgi:hypothetical protein
MVFHPTFWPLGIAQKTTSPPRHRRPAAVSPTRLTHSGVGGLHRRFTGWLRSSAARHRPASGILLLRHSR